MTAAAPGAADIEMVEDGHLVDDPLERFTGLYDQYYRNVLRYALLHAEQGSAEDVASEAFLIAWRQLPNVPDQPLPWLIGVARNLLRKQAGASRRRRLLTERIAALTTPSDVLAWDAGEHVVERQTAQDVLAALPARDVETLTLVTWHGLDTGEAAKVVGCSPRAFTVRLHRARRRLTEALEAAGQPRIQAPRPSPQSGRQTAPLPSRGTSIPRR